MNDPLFFACPGCGVVFVPSAIDYPPEYTTRRITRLADEQYQCRDCSRVLKPVGFAARPTTSTPSGGNSQS